MNKAIFYKEYLKLRVPLIICLLGGVLLAVYAILRINRVVATHGVEHVWLIMLMKDQLFVDSVKYFPPLCGLVLAIAQMRPEMQAKRLKLTLHLPVSNNRVILTMLSAGFAACLLVFALQFMTIILYYSGIIAPEMTWRVALSMLPWYIAGLTAYCFTCAVCLEGRRMRRVVLGLCGFALVSVFYFQDSPEAYNGMLLWAIFAALLLPLLSIVSVNRFKQGLTD